MRNKFVTVARSFMIGSLFLSLLPTPPAAAARGPELGIMTGASLLNMKPTALKQRLQDIKHLGATWIRVDFSWSIIQAKNARTYNFKVYDKVVMAAEHAGLKVLGILTYTPKWARDARCSALVGNDEHAGQKCAPADAHRFAVFAKTVAYRYRLHAVYGWEIWNEPNLLSYWREADKAGHLVVNPVSYARLATRAANAIHAVDPHIAVITGGLSPMYEPTPARGMRQSDFLRDMLPHLTRGGVTAIGIHPYSWPAPPEQAALWNAFYTVDHGGKYNLSAIIGAAHRTDLKLWATEYGAPTVGVTPAGLKPSAWARPDHVNEATQARLVAAAVKSWYSKPNVGPMFIYADSDKYLPQVKNNGGFGLRRFDGKPKPAYMDLLNNFKAIKAAK